VIARNRARLASLGIGNVTFHEADVFAWRPSRRYDLVFMSFWLSHVPRSRFAAFFATLRDALAPGGAVYIIDLPSHKVLTSIEVGARPRSVAFLPDMSRAYVPAENEATLAVVDAKAQSLVDRIKLGDGMRPMGTAMAPDGKLLYVSTGRSKMVLIVDTATSQVVGSIEAGPRPWGIALSRDGRTLYTANGPSNDVSVVDLATRSVTKKIPVGDGPWGVALVSRAAR